MYERNLPTYNAVVTCIGSTGLRHWWEGDEKPPEGSNIIKDGSFCDFHKCTNNYGYVSVWECTNKYGRNLPTYNAVITCIRSAGLHHWWKGDEKPPEGSNIIKDGSVCDFHKCTKNYGYVSARECRNKYGRNLPTYNAVITCIGSAGLRHWWKGDEMSPEGLTIIKEGCVCDFHKHIQNWEFTSTWGYMARHGRIVMCSSSVLEVQVCTIGRWQMKMCLGFQLL